jgi:hypothetical protein
MEKSIVTVIIILIGGFLAAINETTTLIAMPVILFLGISQTLGGIAENKAKRNTIIALGVFWVIVAFLSLLLLLRVLEVTTEMRGLVPEYDETSGAIIDSGFARISFALCFTSIICAVLAFLAAQNSKHLTDVTSSTSSVSVNVPNVPVSNESVADLSVSNKSASVSAGNLESELQKLADLKSKGLIDDEEYKALKQKLL